MYYLTLMERIKTEPAKNASLGPVFFNTKKKATECVFEYACKRIINECPTLFAKNRGALSGSDSEDGIRNHLADTNLNQHFSSLSSSAEMEGVADWWFEFANDEDVEAYYEIGKVDV